MQDTLYTIIEHGQMAARKWKANYSDREYWKGRYFGLQALYVELSERIDGYSDFNNHCGVFIDNSDISDVDENTMTEFSNN